MDPALVRSLNGHCNALAAEVHGYRPGDLFGLEIGAEWQFDCAQGYAALAVACLQAFALDNQTERASRFAPWILDFGSVFDTQCSDKWWEHFAGGGLHAA